jgi:hypothetical protein
MEADGLEEIEAGSSADAGDYYKAGDSFGPTTTPASIKYDGTVSGVEVYNLSAPDTQMTATFRIAGTGAVQTDYAVTALAIDPVRLAPGGQLDVDYTVVNSGLNPSPTNCIRIGLFLSSDTTITPADTSLGEWQLTGCNLMQNQSVDESRTVTIPANTADAVYSLGVLADVTNAEVEANENNNAKATSLEVRSGDQGWALAYMIAKIDGDRLALLRRYRDSVLVNDESGSDHVRALYGQSSSVLKTVLNKPWLLVELGDIIRANTVAVSDVLEGRPARLQEQSLVNRFLDDFAAGAPPDLADLALRIKRDMQVSQRQGTLFFGFSLE